MKKIISILIAVMLVFSFGAMVVSADFVESPGHGTDEGDGEIIVTDIKDINEADPRVDRDSFIGAVDELKGTDDLTDLNDDIKDGSKVRDVFDVTYINEEGERDITFDVNYTDDNYQVIIRTPDGWKVVPSVRNPDGTVTVRLSGNTIVAFLYVPANVGPVTPPTGDSVAAIVACLVIVGVAGSAVLLRRKNFEK